MTRLPLLALLITSPVLAQVSPADKERLLGQHNLSLQWISFERPFGTLTVSERDGKLEAEGQQQGRGEDLLKVSGTIVSAGERRFTLEGTVETTVSHINEGKPCRKEGRFVFRASGNRRYWRLQEMASCGGGNVVDYVDVYFSGEPRPPPRK